METFRKPAFLSKCTAVNSINGNFIFPIFVDDANKYNAFPVTPYITMQGFGM